MKRVIKKSYKVIFTLAILLVITFNQTPVKATNEGSLTIKKFDVNRYENLKESTGNDSDSIDIPADAKIMVGVKFKVEKLLPGEGDTTVTLSTPLDTSFTAREDITDSNGEILFANMPKGYYLVSETIPEGYESPEDGKFFVSIPVKNRDETYTYDVVVYPKNRKPPEEEPPVTPTPSKTPTPSVTVTQTPSVTASPPGDGKKDGGPGAKTDDTTQILGFVLLAIASMGIIAIVNKKRKAWSN